MSVQTFIIHIGVQSKKYHLKPKNSRTNETGEDYNWRSYKFYINSSEQKLYILSTVPRWVPKISVTNSVSGQVLRHGSSVLKLNNGQRNGLENFLRSQWSWAVALLDIKCHYFIILSFVCICHNYYMNSWIEAWEVICKVTVTYNRQNLISSQFSDSSSEFSGNSLKAYLRYNMHKTWTNRHAFATAEG